MSREKDLLKKAQKYAKRSNLTLAVIAKRATKDYSLFTRIEEGSSVSSKVYDRVNAWLDSNMGASK